MTKKRLCGLCARIRDETVYTRWPTHVAHPRDGTLGLWDTRCEAVCPTCGTPWRHGCDNRAVIVGGTNDCPAAPA